MMDTVIDPEQDVDIVMSSTICQVTLYRHGMSTAADETIVEEVPVALVYNGISHAVLLASPQDLEDFALGFSLTEGILAQPMDLYDMEVVAAASGIEVRMHIAGAAMHALKQRRRTMAGRTGCGLCGAESLEQAIRKAPVVPPGGVVAASAIHAAMAELAQRQVLHQATGAVHAAGWATWQGQLELVREDVGRHNALDKVIGAMTRHRVDPRGGFVIVTSRASYEMVQKTAVAGIPLMAAISAPTAMAVRLAEQSGVTLAGFVRGGQHVLYANPERVQ